MIQAGAQTRDVAQSPAEAPRESAHLHRQASAEADSDCGGGVPRPATSPIPQIKACQNRGQSADNCGSGVARSGSGLATKERLKGLAIADGRMG